MREMVSIYSYFAGKTGCSSHPVELPEGASLGELVEMLHEQFPKLRFMARSTLTAVGLEYQPPEYILREGDQVSLFPPVQGG